MQAIALPDEYLREIDRIIFKFLWQKKQTNKRAYEKVKRSTICREERNGGLGAIKAQDQQHVHLIKWFKSVLYNDQTSLQSKLASFFAQKLGSLVYISKASVMAHDIPEISNIQSKFWQSH